jgi:hypothetical protein
MPASPTGMLGTVLIVVVLAALIVVPGFVLLSSLIRRVCFRRREWMMNRSLFARPSNEQFR